MVSQSPVVRFSSHRGEVRKVWKGPRTHPASDSQTSSKNTGVLPSLWTRGGLDTLSPCSRQTARDQRVSIGRALQGRVGCKGIILSLSCTVSKPLTSALASAPPLHHHCHHTTTITTITTTIITTTTVTTTITISFTPSTPPSPPSPSPLHVRGLGFNHQSIPSPKHTQRAKLAIDGTHICSFHGAPCLM